MATTEEQVKHVAKLSKLSFSEEELTDLTNRLNKIIDMVELLEEVDTTGVPFTSNMNGPTSVMREDVATPRMGRKELMRDVPELEDGYIKVPATMDNRGAGT